VSESEDLIREIRDALVDLIESRAEKRENPLVMTVEDVKRELRIKKTRLYTLISSGSVPTPFRMTPRGRPLWLRERIETWLKELADDAERRAGRR